MDARSRKIDTGVREEVQREKLRARTSGRAWRFEKRLVEGKRSCCEMVLGGDEKEGSEGVRIVKMGKREEGIFCEDGDGVERSKEKEGREILGEKKWKTRRRRGKEEKGETK